MLSRRALCRSLFVAGLGGAIGVVGCSVNPLSNGEFMTPVQYNTTTISPNGSGLNDEIDINFTLSQRAQVEATLIGPDGKTSMIRAPEMRAPDQYQIRFRGLVTDPKTNWQRVVPDGKYTMVIKATDASGKSTTQEVPISVTNADTNAPEITEVVINPTTFSPNGDGIDDTTQISYKLSKKSLVQVYVTDSNGTFFLINAPQQLEAALQSFQWDGLSNGNVLPDGKYNLHIEATDQAGNFTSVIQPVTINGGGTPRMVITDVKFSPTAVPLGGDLKVTITVKNTGTVPLKTIGPPPGTKYTTDQNFSSFVDPKTGIAMYYEQPGFWRVGVTWQNAPQPYPVRWGLFTDLSRQLQPNEEATIDGTITIVKSAQHQQVFSAAVVQEGIGYPGGQVGQQQIDISF